MSGKEGDFRADSLSSFIEVAGDLARQWSMAGLDIYPWFRGHASSSWELVPSLYRPYREKLDIHQENEFFYAFTRKGVGFADRIPRDNWEWYVLMRQHGLPTRLLDWSESATVALYFALRDSPCSTGAAVWVLDPWWLNEISIDVDCILALRDQEDAKQLESYAPLGEASEDEHDTPAGSNPVALRPPCTTERIQAQRLTFTVHGANRDPLDAQVRMRGGGEVRLVKVFIPPEACTEILLDITRIAGVTETSVFPDLDGLAREIRQYYEV